MSPQLPRRSRAVARGVGASAVLGLALIISACSDSHPTQPSEQMAPELEVAALRPSISDARERLVVSLADAPTAQRVGDHLRDLWNSLSSRELAKARAAVNGAVTELDGYARGRAHAADGADVSAIQLVLYHAGKLLHMKIDPALLPSVTPVEPD